MTTEGSEAGPGAERGREAGRLRQVRALLGHALLTHLGLFALLPFLPVVLSDDYGLPAGAVGGLLLLFNLVLRSGSVVVTELIERLPMRLAAVAALAVAGGLLLLLGTAPGPWAVVALLAAVAFALSIGGVVSRALLAQAAGERDGRARAFAQLSVIANVAAGSAPLVTGVLTDAGSGSVAFVVSGACYLLAAAVLALLVTGGRRREQQPAGRAPFRVGPYLALWRDRRCRALLVWSVLFWFFYAQQFAGLPLLLERTSGSRTLIGSVYVVSSVLVIVLQVPVTSLAMRRLGARPGGGLMLVFPVGLACMAAYLGLLALGAPALPAVYAASALFALAVMVVVPVMDTLFAELAPADRQVTAFNARKLTWAAGESVGAFVGASGQLWLASAVSVRAYWWVMAGLAAVVAAALLRASGRGRVPAVGAGGVPGG